MTRGAAEIVRRLHAEGRLDAILGLGGSGGSSLVTAAMQALPIGVPKLMVSTVASGDTRPYVGTVDIAMMYSVVDIAGINGISERILANAAAAAAGMARAWRLRPAARREAAHRGHDVRGHDALRDGGPRGGSRRRATRCSSSTRPGAGGRSMEALMRAGFITGVLDVTTTELADELVGGVLSAGPDRLETAGELGLPQVVSLGALDMVQLRAAATRCPSSSATATSTCTTPTITLMRTTEAECAELGRDHRPEAERREGPADRVHPRRRRVHASQPRAPSTTPTPTRR